MNWATKRQLLYFSIAAGVVFILALILIIPNVGRESTCFDGRQNGDETGIDCGGSCPRFCPFEINDIVVHWSRAFPVSSNLYNVVAYIENQNVDAVISSISYEFKLYDEDEIFIAEARGRTFINANKRSAIFETTVDVGNRVPKRVTFRFLETPRWVRVNKEFIETLRVLVQRKVISGETFSPKLTATLINDSLYDIFDIDVMALLYNEEGNVFATSKTFIEKLAKNSSQKIFFTWPRAFEDPVSKIEIIPRINIFSIRF